MLPTPSIRREFLRVLEKKPSKLRISLKILVAQCSENGVRVAATPPCSAIRSVFARKFPRDTVMGRQTGSFLGAVGDVARHPRDISKIAGICCDDTLCATLCSATGVTAML